MEHVILTEDEWEAQFHPVKNPFEPKAAFNGMLFETSGEEMKFLLNINPHNIWTFMDSEVDDSTLVIEGLHWVNRIGYLVTGNPYDPEKSYEIILD